MRFRNTAILAVVVALVGAYLYFVERPAALRESAKKTLVSFDPKDATGIVLEYPDRSLELAERDGKWVITKPRESKRTRRRCRACCARPPRRS